MRLAPHSTCRLTIGSNGSTYVLNLQLGSLDALAPDGTLRWRFELAGRVSSAPAEDASRGRVYVTATSGDLYALSREGLQQWRLALGARPGSAPVIADDKTIYVPGTDSRLRAVSPQGVLLWSCLVEAGITSPPAPGTDGSMHVGSTTDSTAIGSNSIPSWQCTTLPSRAHRSASLRLSAVPPILTPACGAQARSTMCTTPMLVQKNISTKMRHEQPGFHMQERDGGT